MGSTKVGSVQVSLRNWKKENSQIIFVCFSMDFKLISLLSVVSLAMLLPTASGGCGRGASVLPPRHLEEVACIREDDCKGIQFNEKCHNDLETWRGFGRCGTRSCGQLSDCKPVGRRINGVYLPKACRHGTCEYYRDAVNCTQIQLSM